MIDVLMNSQYQCDSDFLLMHMISILSHKSFGEIVHLHFAAMWLFVFISQQRKGQSFMQTA
jgi:hypothetical protein